MAKTLPNLSSTILILTTFTVLFSSCSTLCTAKSHRFSRTISSETLGLKKQKLSHFHFYFHDTISGPKPTAVRVATAPITNTSKTLFGSVMIMDNPLTVGPDLNSEHVGRAQGIYASASQTELELLMVLNLAFTRGKYNGSALSILGRNAVFSTVREMPIVGGSGVFRFARGYAQAKTYSLDFNTAVVEYNVYAFHY